MIIYLFGLDSYRRQQKLKELTENYRRKYPFLAEGFFDLSDEEDYQKLFDFCRHDGLFSGKKMAAVKNQEELKEEHSKILRKFFQSAEKNDNLMLLISSSQGLPEDFEFLSKDPKQFQEFPYLQGEKLKFFIRREAKKRSIDISEESVNFLASILDKRENNSWLAINELEKLRFSKKNLSKNELEDLIDYSPDVNIFEFSNALSRRLPARNKLRALENIFSGSEEPARIFNVIAKNPYLDFAAVKRLADCDLAIKSGQLDYETALMDLCL